MALQSAILAHCGELAGWLLTQRARPKQSATRLADRRSNCRCNGVYVYGDGLPLFEFSHRCHDAVLGWLVGCCIVGVLAGML